MSLILWYNIRIITVKSLIRLIYPVHDFIVMPAVYTALVCVTVYQPWYLALLCWAFAFKVDQYCIPCPMYEWIPQLHSYLIRLKLQRSKHLRGF